MEQDISKMSNDELIKLYNEYKNKETKYGTSQLVKKILLNSQYGASASPFYRYFSVKNASATTSTGQFYIRNTAQTVSDYIDKVCEKDEKSFHIVAGDTDSIYVDVFPILEHYNMTHKPIQDKTNFLDKACKAIEQCAINPLMEKYKEQLNLYQNCMAMDRESICVGAINTGFTGFWCAKKHYALLVNDMEGYRYDDNGHMKVMGLSMVQSSTPEYFRNKLMEATELLIKEGFESVRKFSDEVHTEFLKKTPEEVALPRGVSAVDKYLEGDSCIKGTPIQSRAAINHNLLLKKLGKLKEIPTIKDGDKIKFVFLKPNPHHIEIVGFKETMPKCFELEKYVDKELHYQKAYLKPLSDIFTACGEEWEKKVDLDEFF